MTCTLQPLRVTQRSYTDRSGRKPVITFAVIQATHIYYGDRLQKPLRLDPLSLYKFHSVWKDSKKTRKLAVAIYSSTLFYVIRFVLSVHDNIDIRGISPYDCGGVLSTNFVVRKEERLLSQRCRQSSRKLRDLIRARGIFSETSA